MTVAACRFVSNVGRFECFYMNSLGTDRGGGHKGSFIHPSALDVVVRCSPSAMFDAARLVHKSSELQCNVT